MERGDEVGLEEKSTARNFCSGLWQDRLTYRGLNGLNIIS
jgi:hypothetical protein